MERRRFVALGSGVATTALAGCFGTNSSPGRETTNLEPGGDGPREVTNELQEELAVTNETLLEEDGELRFSLRLENITDEAVTADVRVTLLDADGNAVSEEYTERGVTVEPREQRTVEFDVAESPDAVASYRLRVTAPAGEE